ncbi:MAG: hypothetical protein ACHP65_05950 [Legionellales bacterium]
MFRMFNFFSEQSGAANAHNSMIFVPSSNVESDVFRGGIVEFLNKQATLNGIRRVEVFGENLSEGVYDSSLKLQPEQLQQFMDLINEKGIKELDFTGCMLAPVAGKIIGNALKTNKSLEYLAVTSNQLCQEGMMGILRGLIDNQSLKTLYSRSYNINNYYWSPEELALLAQVISVNPVIENIIVPDNELHDFSEINILSAPYHLIKDRKLATISGLRVGCFTLDFCIENLSELDSKSTMRFANRY